MTGIVSHYRESFSSYQASLEMDLPLPHRRNDVVDRFWDVLGEFGDEMRLVAVRR